MPVETTSFVGRRRELSEIRGMSPAARLLTLTGVGGVGKTRLAVRVAEQVRRSFPDGVWLVELAGLHDPLLLPQVVGNALGIWDRTAQDPVAVLTGFLAGRRLLLVVDNCEHLVPAVADLVVELLRAAPRLRILATSREALQVPGEHLYPVAPLPVPEAGQRQGEAYPAMTLFAERAAAADPRFAVTDDNTGLIAEACRLLDGIPLAIELAAVRLRVLSLEQLVDRLDDRFRLLATGNRGAVPRHQTLRAAVEWSFDLCTKMERLVWMRASVFADGFDLAAAERVCGGDGLSVGDVSTALAGLVEKSVVLTGEDADPGRYRLLETLRQYGLGRLRDPAMAHHLRGVDEALLSRRHLDFYLDLAERFHADWFGPRQVSWSRRMRAALPNLRAALGYCLADPERVRTGVRLAGALHYLWYGGGQAREGRRWLERVLSADPYPGPDRVRALAAYTRIMVLQGEWAATADLAGQCLELARRFDQSAYEADALTILGIGQLYRSDPAGAVPLLTEAVTLAGRLDPVHRQVAYANVVLALAFLLQGDTRRAGEVFADTRRICRAHGEQWYLGLVLFNSALYALALPDPAQALSDGRECLRLGLALQDAYSVASGLELLAWIAAADQDHRRAARLLGAADEQWRTIGGSPLVGELTRRPEATTAARAALGAAVFAAEHRRGEGLTLDEAVAEALGHARPPGRLPDEQPRLTRREGEVAELLTEGLTNKQIATRLVISQRTVETHVQNILIKFGFSTRAQVAAWYAQRRPPT
jgi:predicted ATPase/DNA-binding CsgD family transcriptional regulator